MYWFLNFFKLTFLSLCLTSLFSCNFSIENNKNIKNKINAFTFLKQQVVVEVFDSKFITDISSASGSCISSNNLKKPLILTVAHFCEEEKITNIQLKKLFDDLPIDEKEIITSTRFQAMLFDGSIYNLKVLKMDKKEDICLMEILNGECKNKIKIANNYPEKYSKISAWSAPLAIFSPHNVLIFDGRYIGIDDDNDMLFTLASTYGSSGSPIVNDKLELISMIKLSVSEFKQISVGANLNSVKNFINNK